MSRKAWVKKWQVLGIIGVFALGALAGSMFVGVLTSDRASAHGGNPGVVHACVNSTNAEIRIAHPGPGDASIDCTVTLGAPWTNLDLDDEWLGAGSGTLSPLNLIDRVAIGTASADGVLHLFQSGIDNILKVDAASDRDPNIRFAVDGKNAADVGVDNTGVRPFPNQHPRYHRSGASPST